MSLIISAPQNFPGTLEATLQGCNCGMATVPRRVAKSSDSLSRDFWTGNGGKYPAPITYNDPATTLATDSDSRGVDFSSYDAIGYTRAPYAPLSNDDNSSYWGDYAIDSLTHDLANRQINISLKYASRTSFNSPPNDSSVITGILGNMGHGGNQGLNSNNVPQEGIVETGDVVHIRNVTPVAYSGRYQVIRTGYRTFKAYHSSTTQLSTGAAKGNLIVQGPAGNRVQVFGNTMVMSQLDDSYRRILIKSQHSDRSYPVNLNYIARYLDFCLQSEAENVGVINANTLIRSGAAEFNIATALESFIAPTCPLHSATTPW